LANHKSAIKRAGQNEIRRMRNKSVKTRIKNSVKNLRLAASEKSSEAALKILDDAKSLIDKAAKKGVIHTKTASRKISRLTKLVNTIST
jgi:small subunit ribosomal protein S20